MSIRSRVADLGGAVARPVLAAQDLPEIESRADWVLDAFVEGRHCARGDIGPAGAADLGRTLAKLHALPVGGFGVPFLTPEDAIAGRCETPLAGVLARFDNPLPLDEALVEHPLVRIAPTHGSAVRALIRTIRAEITAGAAVICHSDLHERQLIFSGGRLAALIDFGDVTIADPRWDFASIRYFHGECAVETVIEGYTTDIGSRRELIEGARLFSVAIAMHHASRSQLPGKAHRLAVAASYLDELLQGPLSQH